MSKKSAYQLRFETLCLAKEILSENGNAQRDMQYHLRQDGTIQIKDPDAPDYKITTQDVRPLYDAHTFTTDEVLAEAEKLYEFVCRDEQPTAPPRKPPIPD